MCERYDAVSLLSENGTVGYAPVLVCNLVSNSSHDYKIRLFTGLVYPYLLIAVIFSNCMLGNV